MDPTATHDQDADGIVRDCLAWVRRHGFAASDLAPTDAGVGVGEIVVQAFTYTFFVEVRTRNAHPTRAHVNRQAHWVSHGARCLSVRNVYQLEFALRRCLKF